MVMTSPYDVTHHLFLSHTVSELVVIGAPLHVQISHVTWQSRDQVVVTTQPSLPLNLLNRVCHVDYTSHRLCYIAMKLGKDLCNRLLSRGGCFRHVTKVSSQDLSACGRGMWSGLPVRQDLGSVR